MMNYTDSANVPGNTYAYRVIAANLTKLSAATNPVTVVVPAVPDAPTSLSASLQNGLEVRLKWKDKSTNETGFIIERAVNGGAYAQIATAPGNGAITGDISYTDLNIAAGTSYSYRVAAIAGVLKSAYSNVATINVPAAPAAPTNFVVVNNPPRGRTSRSVTLTWGDASNNETGFTIEVSTSADFTNLFTTSRQRANTTRVVIQNLRPSTDYYFRIRSVNGNVSFSAWVMAVPAPIHTPQ
jgi:predicted phage tail protein